MAISKKHNDLVITGACVHNLKDIDLRIPRDKMVVFTGLSGSGKSSLAFDTIYAEGQRRYMESLSAYARQFLDKMDKPDVEHIEGLSPAISIDQKSSSHNPRSTVGTTTEIYDYLRLLFASIGRPHCPQCGDEIQTQSVQEIVDHILAKEAGTSVLILAPIVQGKKGTFKDLLEELRSDGFSRVRIDGEILRLSEDISLKKTHKHDIDVVVDRITIQDDVRSRVTESVEAGLAAAKGLVLVDEVVSGASHLFSEHLACAACGISLRELSPRLFSFNSPFGACELCKGLGDMFDFDPELVVAHPDNPIYTCTSKVINLEDTQYGYRVAQVAEQHGFSAGDTYSTLSQAQKNIFLYGHKDGDRNNGTGVFEEKRRYGWQGIMNMLRRRYRSTQSEGMRFFFRSYMTAKPCQVCDGARLNAWAVRVRVHDLSIVDMTRMSTKALLDTLQGLSFSEQEMTIGKQVIKEITARLGFLTHVGLDYLTLHRRSGTLSGGEFQRIRLATQIGSGLTGVLYVLDEPSIGLHQRDNLRLIETLEHLRDLGNTLIIVEHDEETILRADHVVDIGPGAGKAGGHIVFSGSVKNLLSSSTSSTAAYLSGKESIAIPKTRRNPKDAGELVITGAAENNLNNITVRFPLSRLVCVTGVSGSGKSTLIHDILHRALMRHFHQSKYRPGRHAGIEGLDLVDRIITIDQSPIGRTPRSNPATYTQAFTPIRELFAQTREAKIRGYKAGRFSFNVKGGRCESCEGDGLVKIEMHFLSDVYVTCDVCKGKRYNDQTLAVTYKGYTISDVLDMTINSALELFENVPAIANKLKTLQDVGLGYIHVGQSATTLSGGEAQRIKLAKELSKRSTGKTLYLLDEPTTGLHFADIKKLLSVLNRLVSSGNTVVVIEHNLDVIKTADYILDLGPEGGDGGGHLVAAGTPEQVAKVEGSHTGKFLKDVLR